METNRAAVLTVRAAVRGVIDFDQADIRDVRWWRKTNTLIKAMARDDDEKVLRAVFDFQLAQLGNSSLTEESFKACQKLAGELVKELISAVHPWENKDGKGAKQREIESLIDNYKKLFGDPNDPAFREKLRQQAEYLAALQRGEIVEPKEPETPEQMVERRLAEKRAARKK